jgi:hypothetical protein
MNPSLLGRIADCLRLDPKSSSSHWAIPKAAAAVCVLGTGLIAFSCSDSACSKTAHSDAIQEDSRLTRQEVTEVGANDSSGTDTLPSVEVVVDQVPVDANVDLESPDIPLETTDLTVEITTDVTSPSDAVEDVSDDTGDSTADEDEYTPAEVTDVAGGIACGIPEDCPAGFCVDGFCCDQLCDGLCMGCGLPGKAGICIPVPENKDPAGECGKCEVCNGEGQCAFAVQGEDPKSDCPQHDKFSCLFDGSCDGLGACQFWSEDTICEAGTCFEGVIYPDDHCDGKGACLDTQPKDCCPYQCEDDQCGMSCEGDLDCCEGFACQGGVCV